MLVLRCSEIVCTVSHLRVVESREQPRAARRLQPIGVERGDQHAYACPFEFFLVVVIGVPLEHAAIAVLERLHVADPLLRVAPGLRIDVYGRARPQLPEHSVALSCDQMCSVRVKRACGILPHLEVSEESWWLGLLVYFLRRRRGPAVLRRPEVKRCETMSQPHVHVA